MAERTSALIRSYVLQYNINYSIYVIYINRLWYYCVQCAAMSSGAWGKKNGKKG